MARFYEISYAPGAKDIEGAIVGAQNGEEVVLIPIEKDDTYSCVMGSRADFEMRGYDTSGLSDARMARIFDKIGDALVEGDYWYAIDAWGEEEGMPRVDPEEEEEEDEDYED